MPKSGADSMKNEPTPKSKLGLIRYPTETILFCVVSILDVAMTYGMLARDDVNFTESNPFAWYFLTHWGIEGMVYFKATMTFVACVITQIVARQEPVLAKRLLGVLTLVIVVVVSYCVWLQFIY